MRLVTTELVVYRTFEDTCAFGCESLVYATEKLLLLLLLPRQKLLV